MSTSLLYHGWGLIGYRYVRRHYGGGKLIFTVQPHPRSLICPVCHGRDVLHHGILAYYDYPISTGPLEGTNNKIKTMKRQAYGFRDKEFLKLKIMAIHLTKYALVG